MRFDRRKIYPEPDNYSKFSALRAIVPKKIGGVIKQLGNPKYLLSVNRAVGKMRDHTQWYLQALKFNPGGVSSLAGSRIGDFGGGGEPEPPPINPLEVILVNGTSPDARVDFPAAGVWPIDAEVISNWITGGFPNDDTNFKTIEVSDASTFAQGYADAVNNAGGVELMTATVVDNGDNISVIINPAGTGPTVNDFFLYLENNP